MAKVPSWPVSCLPCLHTWNWEQLELQNELLVLSIYKWKQPNASCLFVFKQKSDYQLVFIGCTMMPLAVGRVMLSFVLDRNPVWASCSGWDGAGVLVRKGRGCTKPWRWHLQILSCKCDFPPNVPSRPWILAWVSHPAQPSHALWRREVSGLCPSTCFAFWVTLRCWSLSNSLPYWREKNLVA